jgi:hypothetical protein
MIKKEMEEAALLIKNIKKTRTNKNTAFRNSRHSTKHMSFVA